MQQVGTVKDVVAKMQDVEAGRKKHFMDTAMKIIKNRINWGDFVVVPLSASAPLFSRL